MAITNKLGVSGCFLIEHRNKAGKLTCIYRVPNGIVDEGLDMILETMFRSGAQSANWYIGLVDNAGWVSFPDADTAASHAWTEFPNIVETTRPQWTAGAAANRAMTNASTVDFSIDLDNQTLKGIFITDNSVISANAGNLWATAAFSSTVAVMQGDTLKVTYTVSG